MLSLTMRSLSPCSFAISSSTGAHILHGPHHSAQKSTSTGLSLPSTSVLKLSSLTGRVLPIRGHPSLRYMRGENVRGGTYEGCGRLGNPVGQATDGAGRGAAG